jgi:hypothetical protein
MIVSEDMHYAMKYCAMHTVGQDIGTTQENYEDEEDDDDDEDEEDEEDEEEVPFVRYAGNDPRFIAMNEAYDQWESWVPETPAEQMLKNAIDSNGST